MGHSVLFITNSFRTCNGVATVLMNQYQALIDAGYKVDILQFWDIDSVYAERVRKNGGNVITYKILSSKLDNIRKIKEFYKDHTYDIVHINHTDLIAAMFIWCAKEAHVPVIVYHSHNTKLLGGLKRNLKSTIYDYLCVKGANLYLACSKRAGDDVFKNKQFTILHNAIAIDKFKFNNENRKKIRKELNINENDLVIGTVCRYAEQKNPIFMYEIFSEILKKNSNAIFLWVGSAASEEDPIVRQMKLTAKKLKIEEKLRLVGSKDDVYNWYSAMDVFLMPSKWEGLGITYIESQANGLPTFASDVVPDDAKVTALFKSISLNETPEAWAKQICKCKIRNKENVVDYKQDIVDKGYDITKTNAELLKIYQNKLGEN